MTESDQSNNRRKVVARLLLDIAGADDFGPGEVQVLADDRLVYEIYDKLEEVALNLRAALTERTA